MTVIGSKNEYIYESPDKGQTIYRRKINEYITRELVGNKTMRPLNVQKIAIVFGAGGFIGSHLVNRLRNEGFWVRGVDLKLPDFSPTEADDFIIGDLRDPKVVSNAILSNTDELYQLACSMGGAGFIFSGENDIEIMRSVLINLNTSEESVIKKVKRVFYSSSACIYPQKIQDGSRHALYQGLKEDDAYPADPDSEYGWEKLISERLYLTYGRIYGLNIKIARYHNIFGPEGTYKGGREKAPAALCRKVAEAPNWGVNSIPFIEIWGDGKQTRSFLYIDECIEGTIRLMRSNLSGPYNIGSSEMISINALAEMIIDISGKKNIGIKNNLESKTLGVRGRNSDNILIQEKLGWSPSQPLRIGIEKTYNWIKQQV